MRPRMKLTRLASFGALIGLQGCLSLARSEPPQVHYVLGSEAFRQEAAPTDAVSDITVGFRRLKMASYLDVPFMVVRRGANQVDFAEYHRWGEPLKAGINRVVAGALVAHGFQEVAVAPWPANTRFSYLLQIDVARFEGVAPDAPGPTEGVVLLLATWTITRHLDGELIASGTTDYQRQGWRVGDYAGLVTLLEEGLGVIADDLAVVLAGLRPGRRHAAENTPSIGLR